jgi:hypothetical protein
VRLLTRDYRRDSHPELIRKRSLTFSDPAATGYGSGGQGVTEIVKIPNRAHSLTIDHGWREVAQTALDFVKRFVPAKPG